MYQELRLNFVHWLLIPSSLKLQVNVSCQFSLTTLSTASRSGPLTRGGGQIVTNALSGIPRQKTLFSPQAKMPFRLLAKRMTSTIADCSPARCENWNTEESFNIREIWCGRVIRSDSVLENYKPTPILYIIIRSEFRTLFFDDYPFRKQCMVYEVTVI